MKTFLAAAAFAIIGLQAEAATVHVFDGGYCCGRPVESVIFGARGTGWEVFDIPLSLLRNPKVTIAAFYYDKVGSTGIRNVSIEVDGQVVMNSAGHANIWHGWAVLHGRNPISNIMRVSFEDQGGGRGLTIRVISPIPLPASAALLPLGLGTLVLLRRRRKRAA